MRPHHYLLSRRRIGLITPGAERVDEALEDPVEEDGESRGRLREGGQRQHVPLPVTDADAVGMLTF